MPDKMRLASILFAAGLLLAGCYQPTGVRDLLTTPAGATAVEPSATAASPPTAPETEAPTVAPSQQSAPVSSESLRTPSPRVVIVVVTATTPPANWTPVAVLWVATAAETWTPLPPTATPTATPTIASTEPEASPAAVSSTATLIHTSTPAPTPTSTLSPTLFPGEPPRQANGCPLPVDAASLPPNRPSNDLRVIPEHIDFFLYGGGTVARLEEGLRNWGVLIEGLPIITGYFDDNDQPDVAMAVQLIDARRVQYNVWVFNCLGRMLYQAHPDFPDPFNLPTSLSFVEIDGIPPSELLYTVRSCAAAGCQTTWHAIRWTGPNPGDAVDLLRDAPPLGDNVTDVTLTDFDGDGALELRYVEQSMVAPDAPPQRAYIRTWKLQGQAYVQSWVDRGAPRYRHQQVRAADEALFERGVVDLAIQGYQQALSSPTLLDWPEGYPSPGYIPVNAFARFRLAQARLLAGETEAAGMAYYELIFLYPPGVTGGDIAAYAKAFWESYQSMPPDPNSRRERLHAACLAANQSAAYAAALDTARRFGVIEAEGDMCPF